MGTYLSRKLRREAEKKGTQQQQEDVEEEEEDDEIERQHDQQDVGETKGLRVGLIGAPNAGKSMLTNVLLGRKITAVSNKVNTTTSQTFGVLTSRNIQLTIFDTPGVVDHLHYRNMKQKERVSDAYATAALCDALVFVVDAERQLRRPDPRVERLVVEYRKEIETFSEGENENKGGGEEGEEGEAAPATPRSILAMNKVDLVSENRKVELLELARHLHDLGSFDDIFMISSLKKVGTDDLVAYLRSVSRTRRWNMNEKDSSHDHETLAVELVKEQVYRRLNEEIPYVLKIKPVSCKFLRDGSLRIEQDLLVNHVKKKKIVVGRNGQVIGQIGCRARTELERHLNLRVHLILNVRVRRE